MPSTPLSRRPAAQTDQRGVAGVPLRPLLVRWALRRDELCDPKLCCDAADDGGVATTARSTNWMRRRLQRVGNSSGGPLDLRAALDLGIRIGLERDPGG